MVHTQGLLEAFGGLMMASSDIAQALERVSRACGARIATLVNMHEEGRLSCSQGGQDAINAYLGQRAVPDSRQGRVNPGLAAGFRTDLDDFSAAEIARDPYYQEFLAPLDVRWHAVAALPGLAGNCLLSIKRSARQGAFQAEEIRQLNQALPLLRVHARQAALITHSRFEGELSAFDLLGLGAACVASDGRILALNKHLALDDGLVSEQGRLVARHAGDRDTLANALAASSRAEASAVCLVRRPSGKRPYVVDVIRLPPDIWAPLLGGQALVLVNDLDAHRPTRSEVLRRAFGLTPRETDLAAKLDQGLSLREAADRMSITEAHARQRLKVVLDKTGTARQSQLLALLARLH